MKKSNADQRKGLLIAGALVNLGVKIVETNPAPGGRTVVTNALDCIPGALVQLGLGLVRCGIKGGVSIAGVIGNDEMGKKLLAVCKKEGVNTDLVEQDKTAATSWVEIIRCPQTDTSLTLWFPGAGDGWEGKGIDWRKQSFKFFHLVNLGMVRALHKSDPKYGMRVVRLLSQAQQSGTKTSLSIMGDCTEGIIPVIQTALKGVDYCIVDEADATKLTGFKVRDQEGRIDPVAIRHAAGAILQLGPRELVVIRFETGAFARTRRGDDFWKMAVKIPQKAKENSLCLEEAFCVGILAGLVEGWDIDRVLEAGVCMEAAAATNKDGIFGIKSLQAALALGKKYGFFPMIETGD